MVAKIGRSEGYVVAAHSINYGLHLDGGPKTMSQMPLCTRKAKRQVCLGRLKHRHREVWISKSTDKHTATSKQHRCPERLQRRCHPACQVYIHGQESIRVQWRCKPCCNEGRWEGVAILKHCHLDSLRDLVHTFQYEVSSSAISVACQDRRPFLQCEDLSLPTRLEMQQRGTCEQRSPMSAVLPSDTRAVISTPSKANICPRQSWLQADL